MGVGIPCAVLLSKSWHVKTTRSTADLLQCHQLHRRPRSLQLQSNWICERTCVLVCRYTVLVFQSIAVITADLWIAWSASEGICKRQHFVPSDCPRQTSAPAWSFVSNNQHHSNRLHTHQIACDVVFDACCRKLQSSKCKLCNTRVTHWRICWPAHAYHYRDI